jgi:hypothetical protein
LHVTFNSMNVLTKTRVSSNSDALLEKLFNRLNFMTGIVVEMKSLPLVVNLGVMNEHQLVMIPVNYLKVL